MLRIRYAALLIAFPLLLANRVPAHAEGQTVVPDMEREIAGQLGVDGPAETHGIRASELLGSVLLGEDFPALKGRILRARRVTVAPGGVVGVHQHTSRPGVLYMLEGELVETRSDASGPLLRTQGDTSFEKGGLIHWWRNDSASDAVALVVDIVAADPVH